MYDAVLAVIPDIFPSLGLRSRVLREPAIGNVAPDLLVGQWHADLDLRAPSLTNVARHVLAFLQKHGPAADVRCLEDQLFLSDSALSRALDQLDRAGLVAVEGRNGTLRLGSSFEQFSNVKLIAIEMKMKRWREALNQAIRYLEFADEAYVFLDGAQVDLTSEVRRTFEISAPGLYMQRGPNYERVFEACSIPVASADRWLAIQKMLSSQPYCEA